MTAVRNPKGEANLLVGDGYEACVLEPSPPAVDDDPFADDPPTPPEDLPDDVEVISPSGAGDLTWDEWLADHPEHRGWVADRWLGAYRPIGPAPDGLAKTRAALQTLLTNVITPARYRSNGKTAARWTLGGFGTPYFGDDAQVRVEGDRLVVQRGDDIEAARLSTVADAANLVLGQEVPDTAWVKDLPLEKPPKEAAPEERITVDPDVVGYLGDWFGFAHAVLERLRADEASTDATRPELRPEHFDVAVEALPGDQRASYGLSPGDEDEPEPYVYVSLWRPASVDSDDPAWNAEAFPGALLRLAEVVAFDDQIEQTLSWLRDRRDALASQA